MNMKTNQRIKAVLIAAVLTVTSFGFASAQSGAIPTPVSNAFKSEFPNARDVDWDRSRNLYEVEFEMNRLDHEVWYNAEGQAVRHKQELKTRSVPAKVRQSVKKQYRGYRIAEAEKLREGNEVVYKLELKIWTRDFDVFVNEGGEVLEGYIWD